MVRDAEGTARAAEATGYNTPGMCLRHCRTWADIAALYGTAAEAWQHTDRRQFTRNPPRGAFVFWTGGSKGYGHIAVALGGGLVRSTDAGGTGVVATRTIAWFDANWPSQNYVGWTDNVNGVTVPGVIDTRDEIDMADMAELRAMMREEIRDPGFIEKIGDEVWRREFSATNANDVAVKKYARDYLTSLWEMAKRHP